MIKARRNLIGLIVLLLLTGLLIALNAASQCAMQSRSGPVHHFPALPGETVLTDDRAAAIGREVMKLEAFAESTWKLLPDERTHLPSGQPDHFLVRNSLNPNSGFVDFYFQQTNSQRIVQIELRNGEITAQQTLGK